MKCRPAIAQTEAASQPNLATVALAVGTAGHIDHGKTSLVRLLTGCECDTLPEEKARGITIDLGFATCILPDNRRVGIVDVPGHERFIHNMVAGASGIDAVMLVVAADDGVMPQTIEHFHIVRLLGVQSGMIAITKIDLVDETRVAEVKSAVAALVSGSFLERAPVVTVSAKTGAGFDQFYETFVGMVGRMAEHKSDGPFLLHVENAFAVKGSGTVVTGIPKSGSVRVGDTLELLPAGKPARVRGVQVFGAESERGGTGECVALNLPGLELAEVGRGTVLASPGYFTPSKFVNTRLILVPNLEKPLKPRTAVRLHIGTADVPGYLVLPTLENLGAGAETYAQIQLNRPIVASPGDFFVVRQLSPVITLGGGNVVAPDAAKVRRVKAESWVDSCKEKESALTDPVSAILHALKPAGSVPMELDLLSRNAFLAAEVAREQLARLESEGKVIALPGPRYVLPEGAEALRERLLKAINLLHDLTPLSLGFEKKELFKAMPEADHALVDRLLEAQLKTGAVVRNGIGYALPGRLPKLSKEQETLTQSILDLYLKSGFLSPRPADLPAQLRLAEAAIKPVLKHLIQAGELVVIDEQILLHRSHLETSRQRLVEHLQKHGTIESGQFKTLLGTTRKYSIPLQEYWDRHGLTIRNGNNRTLRK